MLLIQGNLQQKEQLRGDKMKTKIFKKEKKIDETVNGDEFNKTEFIEKLQEKIY